MGLVCVLCVVALVWQTKRREDESKEHHAERDKREEKLTALIEEHTRTATEARGAYAEHRKAMEELTKTVAGCPGRR